MTVNGIIMSIMAFGVALGGIDQMLGNRYGLGQKFEDGFRMLGPVALAMAGIICLAPALSTVLRVVVSPVCEFLHLDPGILGSVLAIDMGGLPLSVELAKDPDFGMFSGVIVSSIFGCTLVFSIPVGLGFLSDADRPNFTRSILLGFSTMPISIIVAALMLRQHLIYILWNCLPVLLLSLLLTLGIVLKPDAMMKGFLCFARIIQATAILGLTLAAISHLTGFTLLRNLLPLQDAMETVSSICIVMLGCMPLSELIQRTMRTPLEWISRKTGLNSACTTALLLGLVTATPALAMLPRMNRRGQVVISACLVSCVCTFGAHFAYADSMYPHMVPAMLSVKLIGGILSGALAMAVTRDMK